MAWNDKTLWAEFLHINVGEQKHSSFLMIPILASEPLQREDQKKSSDKMLPPVCIGPPDL